MDCTRIQPPNWWGIVCVAAVACVGVYLFRGNSNPTTEPGPVRIQEALDSDPMTESDEGSEAELANERGSADDAEFDAELVEPPESEEVLELSRRGSPNDDWLKVV